MHRTDDKRGLWQDRRPITPWDWRKSGGKPELDIREIEIVANGVEIVAMLPNPSGRDAGRERVCIRNGSDEAIHLDGWLLVDADCWYIWQLRSRLDFSRDCRTGRLWGHWNGENSRGKLPNVMAKAAAVIQLWLAIWLMLGLQGVVKAIHRFRNTGEPQDSDNTADQSDWAEEEISGS